MTGDENCADGETANELWVVPETSASAEAGLRRLVSRSLKETSLIVATAVESPDRWLSRWCRVADERPANLGVVHVGGEIRSTTVRRDLTRVGEGVPVFTTVPADDIAESLQTLTDFLVQLTDARERTVVYVPALTTLVERAGLETVFRYLHLFTHRIRATGAKGYFQMDASAHRSGAADVLRPLFDRTVTLPADANGAETTDASGEPPRRSGAVRSDAGTRPGAPSADANRPAMARSADGGLLTLPGSVDPAPASAWSAPETATEGLHLAEALLSKEERVRQLLAEQGGRVKQQDIIEQTEWSASTVCRTVSNLEDDGWVEKVRVGRENVVVLDVGW